MDHLSPDEKGRWLDLAMAVLEGEPDPWRLLCSALMERLDAPLAGHFDVRWPSARFSATVAWPQWTDRIPLAEDVVRDHPLVRYMARGRDRAPRVATEVPDDRGWFSAGRYAAARESFGDAVHQVVVPLTWTDSGFRYIGVARAGAPFTEGERRYLDAAQRMLVAADRHVGAVPVSRAVDGTCAGGGCGGTLDLTQRELAVLGLMSRGHAVVAVARRLGISPHTVARHQERIYRKLGTRDRLTTVLVAHRCGLVDLGGTSCPRP